MSNYDLKFSRILIEKEDDELSIECTISGDSFPEPANADLDFESGTFYGSFNPNGDAHLVDAFTFTYSGEAPEGEMQILFTDYPENYTGVALKASAAFDTEEGGFELEGVELKKGEAGKHTIARLKRKNQAGGKKRIASFNEVALTYKGVPRTAGDMEIVDSATDDLTATCAQEIDFNALTEPLLFCWHNSEISNGATFIGWIDMKDNS